MRSITPWAACVLPLTIVLGCTNPSNKYIPDDQATPKTTQLSPIANHDTPESFPSTGSYPPPLPAQPITVEAPPSQSDLDAQAADKISEQNADEEFQKLLDELQGGG